MCNACTPILVGMTSLVSEILLLSKTAKFPFQTMDYSPWSSKNLIDWNRLKKFMQVRIDITCMHTNFGGHGLCYDPFLIAFKTAKISLRTMDYKSMVIKKLNCIKLSQKIYASRSRCVMHVHQFWWA